MSADPDVPLASEALLRPVRPGNPFEDTVERLLQTIRLGVLQPGESLPPERELAAGSGQPRHRAEAIKSLADAGYLVSRAAATAARSGRRAAAHTGDSPV
jgi:DNA-binding FadR family transcriptional regulator